MTPEERDALAAQYGIEIIDEGHFRCIKCGNVYQPKRQTSERDMWWLCGKKGCNMRPVSHGLSFPSRPAGLPEHVK